MDNIEDIKSAVNAFFNNTDFTHLRSRWQEDFDLYRLKPYDAGSKRFSYTTNAPRNLVDRILHALVESKLMIRMPEDVLQQADLERANNLERFLYGGINLNDARLLRLPNTPRLHAQMSWLAVLRGQMAIRVWVYKDKGGETILDIAVWDAYNTAYAIGRDGLAWAAYKRTATREQVREEYGIETTKKTVEIIDFYDEENNGVIVDNEWGKEITEHGLKYPPVFILGTGIMPPTAQTNINNMDIYADESALARNRKIYPVLSRTISDYLTTVHRGALPPMGHWTSERESPITENIWTDERPAVIRLRPSEEFKPIFQPAMPEDAGTLVNIISSEEQRGGIPHVAQGMLGFRLSGYAINSLQAAVEVTLIPFIHLLENAYRIICKELQTQYSAGGFKPVKVRGRTSKNQPFGVAKPILISPEDVKGDWEPEIRLLPTMPRDDIQRYEMALRATQGTKPLLSMRTAREELLELPDTILERERVAQEWAEDLPTLRLYNALMAALADGRNDIALNIVAELQRLLQGRGQGQQPTGTVPMPSPETSGGLPSEVMPFEETTTQAPPGAKNARMPMEATEV